MNSLSKEIIELLNKKQEAAFEITFSLYYPRLVYFAKEYVSYEDAKGLVQDAFVTFWEKNPVVLSESQLQSYLYTLVKNNCLMRLRHEKVKKAYNNAMEIKMQNNVYLSALEQLDTSLTTFQEMESIIKKTLNELSPKCREIFILSRMEGKKNHEIAKELNISVKAVEAQITKALKIFRVSLKDFLPLLAYLLANNP
jgi:RNA polymerase sigma-70 factor, ECF subfamily